MSQTHKAELEINLDQASLADAGSAADFISLMKPRVMSLVVFTALVGLIMAPVSLHPTVGHQTPLLAISPQPVYSSGMLQSPGRLSRPVYG